MKYVSTRGDGSLSFEEALFCCYTDDGGLIMPQSVPKVSLETLHKWKGLNYVEIVKRIVAMYVPENEVSLKDQAAILDEAFRHFDIEGVVKMSRLKDGLNILELWHGNTLAFKDLAMTCTVQFLNHFLRKRKRHFTSVVVTSGDTGSSAMFAARDVDNIDVIVLYPRNRISRLQELMMTTVHADNIHLYAVDGSSDDIDMAASKVLTDSAFVRKHGVGTMNSMNWCRIMVQIAHHVYAYLQTADDVGTPVDVIIPCGGCGNITSCLLAREMGVPIRPVGVCNINNNFKRMVRTNQWQLTGVSVSRAPAMDISFAQNVERVFWLMSGGASDVVSDVMDRFVKNRVTSLPDDVYKKVSDVIRSSVASDDVIVDAMKRCWHDNGYHLCPHTATAAACFYGMTEPRYERENPAVCMATACAAKFSEVVADAGLPVCKSAKIEALSGLEERAQIVTKENNWEEIIRRKILEISSKSTIAK